MCEKYEGQIAVILIKKNFETHAVELIEMVHTKEQIDEYVGRTYTVEDLEKLL